jgi:p-aminobenzoyl-glutamate transporter AbgT
MLWFVSILNVIRNFFAASDDFGSAYGFVTHSFTHTSFVVQTISVGILAVGAFLVVDLYRSRYYAR